jgi:hypothetical protein
MQPRALGCLQIEEQPAPSGAHGLRHGLRRFNLRPPANACPPATGSGQPPLPRPIESMSYGPRDALNRKIGTRVQVRVCRIPGLEEPAALEPDRQFQGALSVDRRGNHLPFARRRRRLNRHHAAVQNAGGLRRIAAIESQWARSRKLAHSSGTPAGLRPAPP